MTLTIDVQTNDTSHHSPEESEFFNWANTTLTAAAYSKDAEISFTVMSAEEITQINQAYRNKNTPTNVLSFPAELQIRFLLAVNSLSREGICQVERQRIIHLHH